jgi:GT2 family glycosyltransferase/2-polyprenyl-3-methyl-5-hydroxy-6-metoxy-1,4-benzoquinol methylase
MDPNPSKKEYPLKNISQFVFDHEGKIFKHPDNITINYQDGGESYIFESMKKINDLSSHSQEFRLYIKDWPSRYHFSNKRVNFLEALKEIFPQNADVLEIGSGCGTITRWLGEQFQNVDALEGDYSRAVITRYRTKDLDNVKVYCGNLLETGFDKKYDIITLIGSLEYLPFFDRVYNDPKKVCSAILTRLNNSLKDNGILLIAIENKFGAKYFSGCKEDHTGKEFEGIIGYPEKTQVTFSRNELESIIFSSEFAHSQFYHVFPDYKLTDTIIPETTEVLSLHPYNWISTPFEDYSGKFLNIFPDILFIKSVTDSGLLWQFSNSFIVLTSKTKNVNLSVNWLIKKFYNNDFSKPNFFHTITLGKNMKPEKTEIKYFITRSSVSRVSSNNENDQFLFELRDNNFVPGKLLLFDFVNALFKKSPEKNLKQVLRELHGNLLNNYSIGENDLEEYPKIKGDTIDYTFWNLITTPDNKIEFIDRKWKSKKPLSAEFILFRNLFWIFDKISPFLQNKDKSLFIISMISDIYPQYSENRLIKNLEFENAFQYFVTGENQNLNIDNLRQYNVVEQVTQNQERLVQIQVLQQKLTKKDLLIEKLNNDTKDLHQTVLTKDLLIEKLNDKTQELQKTVTAKDRQLYNLQQKVDNLQQKVDNLQQKVDDLQQKITDIEKSIVWQFTMKFHHKIIEQILPQNTRRRKYYDLFRAGGKILINNGFQAFYFSFNRHIYKNKKLNDYQKWIEKYEPKKEDIGRFKRELQNFSYCPKISIVLPVWNTDEIWLRLAIESVINQIYENWELCIVDGGSTKSHVKRVLNEYTRKDLRIKVKFLTENKGIAGNSNEALSLATGDFVGFLDHDDELVPFTLYEVVKLINKDSRSQFIYSDEDKMDENGNRKDAFFKPDWAPAMFLSHNYICHFSIIKKTLIDSVGGFRSGYDGSQDYDLFLRVTEKIPPETIAHIPKILYHWRMIKGSAADQTDAKPYAITSAKKALSDALIRRGIQGEVSDGLFQSSYRIRYAIHGNPKVSIIIPTRDKVEILKRCIQSILEKTTYDNYEIVIVDNQSTDPNTAEYYLTLKNNPRIRLLHYDKPFNFSAINNFAVAQVDSPYILFLNNDTEVISDEWLTTMLEHAQQTNVGAVGAKLLYPNNTIQHAGVIIGIIGNPAVGGHSHRYLPDEHPGYFGRASHIQEVSAITAACLLMKKEVFNEIGGFNEDLAIAFNDVDLCLKIREKGYLIIYTPYARLYHHESLSRGVEDTVEKQERFKTEVNYIREHWGSIIDKGDPYYNLNLTRDKEDFSLKN